MGEGMHYQIVLSSGCVN